MSSTAQRSEPQLWGIISTYRRPAILPHTLQSLASQDRPLDWLLVVDNSPCLENRETLEVYAATGLSAEYLPSPENLGPAGAVATGMSIALRRAQPQDWVVLLDDDGPTQDGSVLSDLLAFSKQKLLEDPRVGAVGLRGATFNRRRVRLRAAGVGGREALVDYLWSSWSPIYRVSAIRDVGVFMAKLFFGFEELEYGLRLRRAGYTIYATDLGRPHDPSEVRRRARLKLEPLNWRRYYSLRNLIHILRMEDQTWSAAKVALIRGLAKPALNLPLTPRLASRHLGQSGSAIADGWTGRLGRTIEPDGALRRPVVALDAPVRTVLP